MDELRIIKYLDGEMPEEERRAFEDEIRMNPALAEELQRYRHIQDLAGKLLGDVAEEEKEGAGDSAENGLDPAVKQEIEEAVLQFKKNPDDPGKVPESYRETLHRAGKAFFRSRGKAGSSLMIRNIWYRAAAVVVLGVTISILILRPFGKISPDEIYAHYFRPFHKTDRVVELARADNDLLFAIQVYEAGDFERAVALFEMLADSSGMKAWPWFYAGSTYMSLNRPEKAIDLLKKAMEEGDREVDAHARWQLSLCYIRIGEPSEARKYLETLKGDPDYRRAAGKILRILGH